MTAIFIHIGRFLGRQRAMAVPRMLLAAGLSLLLISVVGSTGFAATKTKCGALTDPNVDPVTGIAYGPANPAPPSAAPAIECPTPPCAQNACQIQRTLNLDGTYTIDYAGGNEYQNCGAFTACVLQGEDPPLNNPQWDESSLGYMVLGSGMLSGKCAPPRATGKDDPLGPNSLYPYGEGGTPAKPKLYCPATKLGVGATLP